MCGESLSVDASLNEICSPYEVLARADPDLDATTDSKDPTPRMSRENRRLLVAVPGVPLAYAGQWGIGAVQLPGPQRCLRYPQSARVTS